MPQQGWRQSQPHFHRLGSGLFSLARVLFSSILPTGKTYTFWGEGVSQRSLGGCPETAWGKAGSQYTVPVPETVEKIRQGETPVLTPREEHFRICYVVPEPGADRDAIEKPSRPCPATSRIMTQRSTSSQKKSLPLTTPACPTAAVITTGTTGGGYRQQAEFRLKLENNPEFTGSVLAACAGQSTASTGREDRCLHRTGYPHWVSFP